MDLGEYERIEKKVPTMKTLGGSDGAKKVEKAASAEVKTEAKPAERIDFSNVKIEPLFGGNGGF